MTFYNYLLTFLSAGFLFFALYYLFAVVFIHKKIFEKHFYFVLTCFFASIYLFCQLQLTMENDDASYLFYHRLKFFFLVIGMAFLVLTMYECYFYKAKKYIPYILLITAPFLSAFAWLNLAITNPIKIIDINILGFAIQYHLGKTTIYYSIYSFVLMGSLFFALIQYLISNSKSKRKSFLVIIVIVGFSGINDFLVAHGILYNILLSELFVFSFIAGVFIDFLFEDKNAYINVIDLKNESERRLRITEIYTRRSLVEEIEKGNDPTKFKPESIKIATLFTDIRDFTGITEGDRKSVV